jgi:hypothetical protein
MKAPPNQDPYEARVSIENKILYRMTGKNLGELQILLHEKCLEEKSGIDGEIIELSTGKTVYRCSKQTIIDQ